MLKKSSLFRAAQLQLATMPALCASAASPITYTNARASSCGTTRPLPLVAEVQKADSSTPLACNSATTGSVPTAAQVQARTTYTSVPAAEARITELRTVLEARRLNALTPIPGDTYLIRLDSYIHILTYHTLYNMVSLVAFPQLLPLTPLLIIHPSTSTPMPLPPSLNESSALEDTWALSQRLKWKLLSAPFKQHHCPSSPSRENQGDFVLFRTCLIAYPLSRTPSRLLIHPLTRTYILALTVLSPPSASWFGAYLQALKEQLMTWQKPTGLSPCTLHNTLASSSA
jgi:hypothetical protein